MTDKTLVWEVEGKLNPRLRNDSGNYVFNFQGEQILTAMSNIRVKVSTIEDIALVLDENEFVSFKITKLGYIHYEPTFNPQL